MPFLDIAVTLEFHPSKNGAVACRIRLAQDIVDLLRNVKFDFTLRRPFG